MAKPKVYLHVDDDDVKYRPFDRLMIWLVYTLSGLNPAELQERRQWLPFVKLQSSQETALAFLQEKPTVKTNTPTPGCTKPRPSDINAGYYLCRRLGYPFRDIDTWTVAGDENKKLCSHCPDKDRRSVQTTCQRCHTAINTTDPLV